MTNAPPIWNPQADQAEGGTAASEPLMDADLVALVQPEPEILVTENLDTTTLDSTNPIVIDEEAPEVQPSTTEASLSPQETLHSMPDDGVTLTQLSEERHTPVLEDKHDPPTVNPTRVLTKRKVDEQRLEKQKKKKSKEFHAEPSRPDPHSWFSKEDCTNLTDSGLLAAVTRSNKSYFYLVAESARRLTKPSEEIARWKAEAQQLTEEVTQLKGALEIRDLKLKKSQEEVLKLNNTREAQRQSLSSLKDENKTLKADLEKLKADLSTAMHESSAAKRVADAAKKDAATIKSELDKLKPELENVKQERLDLMTTVRTYPQNYEVAQEEGVKKFKAFDELQGTLKVLMGPALADGYTRAVNDVKQIIPELDVSRLQTKNLYAPGIGAVYSSRAAELFAGENIAKKYLNPTPQATPSKQILSTSGHATS